MATRVGRYRRTTDRIQDMAAWLLLVAGMLLIVISCTVGLGTSGRMAERARIEAQDRVPAVARLLADSEALTGEYATRTRVMVAASWQDQRGVEHTGPVSAPQGLQAGHTARIWIDRTGAAVSAPTSTTDVLVCSAIAAGLVLAFGASALAVLWLLVRRATLAYNCAQWEREWREVAPVWSNGEGVG